MIAPDICGDEPLYAPVAQLDRAQTSDVWCRWFESVQVHQPRPQPFGCGRGYFIDFYLNCVAPPTQQVRKPKKIRGARPRIRRQAMPCRTKWCGNIRAGRPAARQSTVLKKATKLPSFFLRLSRRFRAKATVLREC